MEFKVQTEQFEGPIGLLLDLIEKRKLPINDISLASIADDYIKHIQNIETDSLSNKTYFIFVASTLTLIKSKSILPTLDLTEDEEDDIESLKKRIALFKEFQDAALVLKTQLRTKPTMFYARPPKRTIEFEPHEGITIDNIRLALTEVFKEIPEKPTTKKEGYIKIAVHIEEMMISLEERINQTLKTNFESFISPFIEKESEPKNVRTYRVVGFLAMLELVKKGAFDVIQKQNFSSIEIEKL